MLSPILLLDVRKFHHDLVCRFSLQVLHQFADRNLRRNRYQQMDVILRHMTFHDLYIIVSADLSNQIADTQYSLSLLVLESDVERAVQALHARFVGKKPE